LCGKGWIGPFGDGTEAPGDKGADRRPCPVVGPPARPAHNGTARQGTVGEGNGGVMGWHPRRTRGGNLCRSKTATRLVDTPYPPPLLLTAPPELERRSMDPEEGFVCTSGVQPTPPQNKSVCGSGYVGTRGVALPATSSLDGRAALWGHRGAVLEKRTAGGRRAPMATCRGGGCGNWHGATHKARPDRREDGNLPPPPPPPKNTVSEGGFRVQRR